MRVSREGGREGEKESGWKGRQCKGGRKEEGRDDRR